MNKKQYHNVIHWTLKQDESVRNSDALTAVRAIFKNMGVALPNGNCQEINEVLATGKYMNWKPCDYDEVQKLANKGVAVVGISNSDIVVIDAAVSAEESLQTTETASTFARTTDVLAPSEISAMSFYSYNSGNATTTEDTTEDPTESTESEIYFDSLYETVEEGWSGYIPVTVNLPNSADTTVYWSSDNPDVAYVNRNSELICTETPGIANITAQSAADPSLTATCELWVHGDTPVILIHGRTSNSFGTWGAGNMIFTNPLDPDQKDNDHFDSSVYALSAGETPVQYINKSVQDIVGYNLGLPMVVDGEEVNNFEVPAIFNGKFNDGKYTTEHPEGGNLAYFLKQQGYKENITLFIFNYPNEDAVIHSAIKLRGYINNLSYYVRTSGNKEMIACFYSSRAAYNANEFKINLVGHSMGGLVSRYYIENLGCDEYVDKLITICTPHWGSGYADLSNTVAFSHVLCDHDLDFDSAMYGGDVSTNLNCNTKGPNCYNDIYTITDELQYATPRHTKYYAIAGIDYNASSIDKNDYTFEMPTNFTTYQQIIDYMTEKSVYKTNLIGSIIPINVKAVGDNMVGFMSQIGWTKSDGVLPDKRIQMEKIFIDVDTNGGNGDEVFIWEVVVSGELGKNILHSKINHRIPVCNKVIEYLGE